ncbi:MAG: patatin-like phospholipase family protein [Bacteroidales bacterium]|nr:patatin-like phospholipase family protein [Bacteroidales bacterium]
MQKDTETCDRKFKLGVALTGGGARGLAHAGALAAIEEAGLRPDIMAGVSAGSLAAVLYAAGNTPRHILELFTGIGFRDLVEFRPHHGGLFGVEPFKKFIAENTKPYVNLEDFPIKVYIGATDFDHGVPVEFHEGEILPRVVASCSIPIIFKPVEIDGVNYVDGGVLRNHPAWIIRDKCETLIGINVSPLKPRPGTSSFVDVAMRTYNLMAKANQLADMQLCDVSVETPEIASYRTFDLRSVRELYLSGYIHTRKALRDAGLWKPKS